MEYPTRAGGTRKRPGPGPFRITRSVAWQCVVAGRHLRSHLPLASAPVRRVRPTRTLSRGRRERHREVFGVWCSRCLTRASAHCRSAHLPFFRTLPVLESSSGHAIRYRTAGNASSAVAWTIHAPAVPQLVSGPDAAVDVYRKSQARKQMGCCRRARRVKCSGTERRRLGELGLSP